METLFQSGENLIDIKLYSTFKEWKREVEKNVIIYNKWVVIGLNRVFDIKRCWYIINLSIISSF